MRRTRRTGSFWLCLIINMLLNSDGLIPAAILLILHILFDLSLRWAILAAALWMLWIVLEMLLIGWARDCGNIPDQPKKNKNPYSAISSKNDPH